jgi:hypothetical protein
MKTLPAAASTPLLLLVAWPGLRVTSVSTNISRGIRPQACGVELFTSEGCSLFVMSSRACITAAGGGAKTGFREDGLHSW